MINNFEIVSCTAVGSNHQYLVAVTKDGRVFYGLANGAGGGWDRIRWKRTTDIPMTTQKND